MHERYHMVEKPFGCTICDYKCAQIWGMTGHMRTHKVSIYSCSFCVHTSLTIDALERHMCKHTGEDPNKCTICDKVCSSYSALKVHVMNNHTDKESEEYKEFRERINEKARGRPKQKSNETKNAYRRARYANDDEYRVRELMRGALNRFLKGTKGKRSGRIQDIIGCTWKELIDHLNDNPHGYLVGQKGMTIDHIRCILSFILFNGPIGQRECCNFNNLQLLTIEQNSSKGSDYNAEKYAESPAGKAIALLRPGWEKEFPTDEAEFCEDSDSDDEYEDEE